VKIVREGTDFLEIEADLPAPAILLVTDCWTPAWRAVPLPGSEQESYRLFPANYALRGVSLMAGKQRLRMVYVSIGFIPGMIACCGLWSICLGCAFYACLRCQRDDSGSAEK
jgi:hypothetical protein